MKLLSQLHFRPDTETKTIALRQNISCTKCQSSIAKCQLNIPRASDLLTEAKQFLNSAMIIEANQDMSSLEQELEDMIEDHDPDEPIMKPSFRGAFQQDDVQTRIDTFLLNPQAPAFVIDDNHTSSYDGSTEMKAKKTWH